MKAYRYQLATGAKLFLVVHSTLGWGGEAARGCKQQRERR
jgi:hypothetical protein